MKKIVISLWCLLLALNVTAQNDEVYFRSGIEPETGIHVGQEFFVSYLSDAPIYQMDSPEWGKSIEIVKVTPMRTSQTVTTGNGEKVEKKLAGKRFTLKVHQSGKITIPAISANIEGKSYTCEAQTIKILPPKKIKKIHCSFSTNPKEVLIGTKFYLTLSCDYRPDTTPGIEAKGLRLLATSSGYSSVNGKATFQYTYVMAAIKSGEFIVTPTNLTFNGVIYKMEPYSVPVRTQRMFQEL